MGFSTTSIAKRVLPLDVVRIIGSFRNGARHARAAQIHFGSDLNDSSAVLYGLVRSMKPEVCVEIGSARGKSTTSIAAGLKENGRGKLYAIDPHMPTQWNDRFSVDTFDILRRNIAVLGLSDQVEIIRSLSKEAARHWTRPIDLLFIDGDHSYEGVKQDWDMFVKYVSKFGVVVFHDTIWDLRPNPEVIEMFPKIGVPRFVDKLRQQGYPVITLERDCGLSMCSRSSVAFRYIATSNPASLQTSDIPTNITMVPPLYTSLPIGGFHDPDQRGRGGL